jgi:hypothetical protein
MSTTQTTTTKGNKMTITIDSVNTETLTCTGTCNGHEFTSAPFRWGSKMLMKVTSTHEFTQGEKVSIGHASKKALKVANLTLPEAKLVRPRKPKGEASEAPPEVESTPEA